MSLTPVWNSLTIHGYHAILTLIIMIRIHHCLSNLIHRLLILRIHWNQILKPEDDQGRHGRAVHETLPWLWELLFDKSLDCCPVRANADMRLWVVVVGVWINAGWVDDGKDNCPGCPGAGRASCDACCSISKEKNYESSVMNHTMVNNPGIIL